MNNKRLYRKLNAAITSDFKKRKYGVGCGANTNTLEKLSLLTEIQDWKATDPSYSAPYEEPFTNKFAFSYYDNARKCPIVSGGDMSGYEQVANKTQDFTIIDNTHYPSTQAVLNFFENIEDNDQILVTTDW